MSDDSTSEPLVRYLLLARELVEAREQPSYIDDDDELLDRLDDAWDELNDEDRERARDAIRAGREEAER